MLDRRRFLHESLIATASLSVLPGAGAWSEQRVQDDPICFDLHSHPGALFSRGTPSYAGDAHIVRTTTSMRDAKITGCFFSLVADAPLIEITPTGVVTRGEFSPGDGAREYDKQLATVRELIRTTPAFLATRTADLLRAQREQKVAAFLACEGSEFLDGKPERIDQLHADGVRSLQLVHYVPNALGDLQTQPRRHGGLSELGKAVVKRTTSVGMVIDVAHASFDTVRDVTTLTSAPLILSHSILKIDDRRPLAARAITEAHATLVGATGGVIGAWPSGFNASFDEFVDNTKRLIDLVGIDHVGLGTDMDGNFKPVLSAYAQVRDWGAALQAKGFSRSDVAKVLGGNMQRVLQQVIG